ncbi:hypothetical protein D9758_003562 [Tetrapyrgos nigripes]|uniref:Endonuclease/exonuclease/phosphatase domain-containing protein n=1 Tax=Tetrapyrgos nigripes TaxID=182062 RepID=A0A8H5GUQ1_9AGAR|nr:hypothetical protein D9758_003562 [Tetrapyrgos nigripes]
MPLSPLGSSSTSNGPALVLTPSNGPPPVCLSPVVSSTPSATDELNTHRPFILNVRSWNLNGSYDCNSSHPKFKDFFDGIDVFMIQETHSYAHENLLAPEGFTLYSCNHTCSDYESPWGGIATLICSSLNAKCIDTCNVFILNGAESIPGNHFHFMEHHNTSKDDQDENIYQCTVIDYALASMECLPFITNFEVSPHTDWSDHSFLSLSIILPGGPPSLPSSSYSHLWPKFHTPLILDLDQLLDNLMKQPSPSPEEQWSNIYGLATLEGHACPLLVVHISGTCSNKGQSNATTGSSIFFGF